jgi:hypothetical protein
MEYAQMEVLMVGILTPVNGFGVIANLAVI